MPDKKETISHNETVCSAEFGAESCKVPPESSEDEDED